MQTTQFPLLILHFVMSPIFIIVYSSNFSLFLSFFFPNGVRVTSRTMKDEWQRLYKSKLV